MSDLDKRAMLKLYLKQYYDYQDVRKAFDNRTDRYWENEGQYPQLIMELSDKADEFEETAKKGISEYVKQFQLWNDWMEHVKGIGPVMAGNVIGRICLPREDVTVFKRDNLTPKPYWTIEEEDDESWSISTPPIVQTAEKVTQLWSYCGLTPDSNRESGESLSYDPELKELFAYKIPGQFMKARGRFKQILDDKRERLYDERDDIESEGHALGIAKMVAGKIFASHVWMMWRKQHDFPIVKPYIADTDGKHHTILPFRDASSKPEDAPADIDIDFV
jgi:hypothetical protein